MLARNPTTPKASGPPPPVALVELGRPAFEPSAMHRQTVTVMVAGGIQQAAIAGALGILEPTLRRHFRKEVAKGASEVALIVVAAHLKRIKPGDIRAINWWEKARMGWTESVVVDDGKPNMPMRVIIELVGDPAPVTIEQERQPRPGFDATKLVQLVG